jgi:catechol 2,3-dioxygenase-like lactoylglutathione lyase family enzyme
MTFTSLRPMLRTKDFEGTIDFYTRHLGFKCDGRSDADGWASLRRDAVWLMVATPNAHMPFDAPAFTGSFYFNVDDAGALWGTLKDHARVCYPMEDFHYGMREFAIFDNNGYLLQFGQPLPARGA